MSAPIPALSSASPVPHAEATRPVATIQQLQQLLEQSLRDLRAESGHLESVQEAELSQALQRLSGRLHHILAESTEAALPQELAEFRSSHQALLPDAGQPASEPLHFMTSCEGVVVMVNDPALALFGMDVSSLGKVSVREWIPNEEWQWIRPQLQAEDGAPASVRWIMTLELPEGRAPKMRCSVTPLLDHSRRVMSWHWDLRPHQDKVPLESLAQFVQNLEAGLINGQGLNDCLRRLCEGLVDIFGYSFAWMATVRDGQRIQLRAHAGIPESDWDAHGRTWWASISQLETLAQACVASDASFVSLEHPYTGEFSWFPSNYALRSASVLPFRQGADSGLLVLCSTASKEIGVPIRACWESLGPQIGALMARGMELDQLRFHSAIIGAIQDPMCLTDQTGRVEWVNQAYLKLLGVTPHQVLGRSLRSFPFAQLYQARSLAGSPSSQIRCVKTEVMERGNNAESLVLEQVVAPLGEAEGGPTRFMVTFHDVTARAVAEMQMKHQAYHDALTDLPNRVMFEDRLQLALAQARRDGTLVALLFLDLDNFKSINDQYGHQMGDRLLRVVAKRLVTCVRTTDTVSRLSGDEFTIILQGLDRIHDIRQVAQKIVECLTAPIHVSGKDLSVQTSIGIAVSPKDATTSSALLAIADQAMYRAKDFGGQRWYFATPEWNLE
ncbi:MAG: diguanylate cyclase [Nitrospirota bacterium]|nr:diguanylate cyclase [Nitrospirota bacterium]